jgi:hypothetical protein
MRDARCKTCPHQEYSQCRRRAPIAVPLTRPDAYGNQTVDVETWFPTVDPENDWCGEHPDRRVDS